MQELLAALGLKKGAVIAGFIGGAISYRWFKELPWGERILTVTLGILLGAYGGPAINESISGSEKLEVLVIILVSALGITILSALVKAMPDVINTLVTGLRDWIAKK